MTGRRHDDRGAALLLVVGSMLMISAILLTTLAFTVRNAEPTRRDQDAKTALAAAQAGIDEYVSRLTANDNYWLQGNSDGTNPALGAGQNLQGTAGQSGRYRYTVLSTPESTAQDGQIRLQVTGLSSPGPGRPDVTRTLIATLRVRGFLDYVYLSDVEVVDPEIIDPTSPDPECTKYYYDGRSEATGCSNIQWAGGDVVNGQLHSNDALWINGAVTFQKRATSSWPVLNGSTDPKTWWGSYTGTLPAFSPTYAPPVNLPESNASLLQYVAPDVDGNAGTPAGPGCYYQGATEIVFQTDSMLVRSPMTSRTDTPSRCLNYATRASWQTISPIPPVIYVDTATSGTCVTGDTSKFSYPQAGENWTAGSATAVSWGLRAIAGTWWTPGLPATRTPNYSCMRGSAYIKGTVSGPVTVATADDVVITGNLEVASSTGADVIGLIGGNCVWVYHPTNAAGGNLAGFTPVTKVQAAVLALRHSFLVQAWSRGNPLGTLNVTGALAQRYRGPVGTGNGVTASTGYLKNYVYDGRLANLQPPYFLKPTSTPWRVSALIDG